MAHSVKDERQRVKQVYRFKVCRTFLDRMYRMNNKFCLSLALLSC